MDRDGTHRSGYLEFTRVIPFFIDRTAIICSRLGKVTMRKLLGFIAMVLFPLLFSQTAIAGRKTFFNLTPYQFDVILDIRGENRTNVNSVGYRTSFVLFPNGRQTVNFGGSYLNSVIAMGEISCERSVKSVMDITDYRFNFQETIIIRKTGDTCSIAP